MSAPILRPAPAPGKPAPRPHDPDVCGLDPATDCAACRATWERAEATPQPSIDRQLWARMVDGVPWLEQLARAGLHDWPDMPTVDFGAVAVALAALSRADVRERVLMALAPGIRAIIQDELRGAA